MTKLSKDKEIIFNFYTSFIQKMYSTNLKDVQKLSKRCTFF
jgi:hypothetical protein